MTGPSGRQGEPRADRGQRGRAVLFHANRVAVEPRVRVEPGLRIFAEERAEMVWDDVDAHAVDAGLGGKPATILLPDGPILEHGDGDLGRVDAARGDVRDRRAGDDEVSGAGAAHLDGTSGVL